MTTPEPQLADAVNAAAQSDELMAALGQIYDEIDAACGDRPCKACGACCDFETFGHRLYVSTAEIAYLLRAAEVANADCPAGRCPWQSDNLCLARDNRALGCRVFNCHSDSECESAIYELFHEKLRQLHASFDIPYFYVYLPKVALLCERL